MKDHTNDGKITTEDVDIEHALREIDLKNAKMETQKNMAWFSLVMIAVVTAILFSPMISDSRITALSDLLGLFYISTASIAGAFVGVTAWMSRSK